MPSLPLNPERGRCRHCTDAPARCIHLEVPRPQPHRQRPGTGQRNSNQYCGWRWRTVAVRPCAAASPPVGTSRRATRFQGQFVLMAASPAGSRSPGGQRLRVYQGGYESRRHGRGNSPGPVASVTRRLGRAPGQGNLKFASGNRYGNDVAGACHGVQGMVYASGTFRAASPRKCKLTAALFRAMARLTKVPGAASASPTAEVCSSMPAATAEGNLLSSVPDGNSAELRFGDGGQFMGQGRSEGRTWATATAASGRYGLKHGGANLDGPASVLQENQFERYPEPCADARAKSP